MAKRKAARAAAKASARSRRSAKRGGGRAAGGKKTVARGARKARKKSPSRRAASRPQARARKAAARKAPPKRTRTAAKGRLRTAPAGRLRGASASHARKVPALNRERRTVREEEMVPSPPSSLDLDRSASAVRSGRRELHERLAQHNETSPALTGGDIDADWESAYSSGDEAPGGDNPTPDQDIVDDIGKAVGVQYEDNEELKGETKIKERDKKRWELDPASSEDYNDR